MSPSSQTKPATRASSWRFGLLSNVLFLFLTTNSVQAFYLAPPPAHHGQKKQALHHHQQQQSQGGRMFSTALQQSSVAAASWNVGGPSVFSVPQVVVTKKSRADTTTTSPSASTTASTTTTTTSIPQSPVATFASVPFFVQALEQLETSSILPTPPCLADSTTTGMAALLEHDDTDIDEEYFVVKYFATYCKMCQRTAPHYKRLAQATQQQQHEQASQGTGSSGNARRRVHFWRVQANNASPNKSTTGSSTVAQIKSLGVTQYPYVQIYRRTRRTSPSQSTAAAGVGGEWHVDRVASFTGGGNAYMFRQRVSDAIDECLERTPTAWEAFDHEHAADVAANHQARQLILTEAMVNHNGGVAP